MRGWSSHGNLALTNTNGKPAPADTPPPGADKRPAPPRKSKTTRDFWRATRFIWPYRKTIVFSFFCALFVGLAMSVSLATLTPIMKVLLSKQTIREWANTTIVEQRLGLRLVEDALEVQVLQVKEGGTAAAAGIQPGDRL